MTKNKVPIVAIVGRANVGKSSLFNFVLGAREVIVADEPGTTRDSIYGKASYEDKDFWLVDTAGLKAAEDDFEFTIQEQIAQAADSADIIIVMIEAPTVIIEEDRRVTKMALKTRKPVVLAVNKSDQVKNADLNDYRRLGIKDIFLTSVTQGRGIEELFEFVAGSLPKASILVADDRIHLAILGRPNVGKSNLFNALAKKQQALVADRAGTTRDINRTVIKYMGKEIELMDTAGIRRSGRIERGVEKFSVIRSLNAIEQADICLLLIDANEPSVALDQKIAGMISEAHRGLVLILSKWDSLEDKDAYTHDKLMPTIKHDFVFIPWAPLIVTSSVTGHNVSKIFDLSLDITETRAKRIKTTDLNKWLEKTTDRHPPAGLKNRQPKLRYVVQEEGMPYPSFKVFGSQLKYLHWSYRRHLERTFRETFDFAGTPIKFWWIDQHKPRVHGTKRQA
ncbi:MAG: ribosome biogenesis GTPase Der [bacterium]|nr:ribosome biogenesis GTPase Der [bacterium]